MNKIKVLHVIKTLDLGGAEVNLLNLAGAFDPARIETHVAYSAGGYLEPQFLSRGVRLFKFAKRRHKLKSPASLVIIARLANYILRNDIQIIHTHTFNAHIWAGIAAKITGRKIVEHVHDYRYLEPQDRTNRKVAGNQFKYIKYFKNFSDRVIVLTKQNYNFLLEQKLYPPEKIRVYYNGIPISKEEPVSLADREALKKRLGILGGVRVILTPARLSPEKNLELIFRIAPRVFEKVPQALFLIAGDGPLSDQLMALSAAAGISGRIRLIGFFADITQLLKMTDVFILPSFLELHSLAVLEAMNKKVPVVLSRVGCNDEFIENRQNGIILDPFKDEGWAEAVIELLLNEKMRQEMGENANRTCLRIFNIKDAAARLEKLYAELLEV